MAGAIERRREYDAQYPPARERTLEHPGDLGTAERRNIRGVTPAAEVCTSRCKRSNQNGTGSWNAPRGFGDPVSL